MDLSPYIAQLREDLSSAAQAGDEQTQQTAAVLAAAVEPAARLAIMNALSDLAAEVTTHLDEEVVELRLDGRDVRVVISSSGAEPVAEPEAEEEPPPTATEGGDISRITLRLLDEVKAKAEHAAAAQGVSLNTWVAQAVQGALHGGRPRGPWDHHKHAPRRGGSEGPGSRIRGWVRG
jgi:predicted HicB family RNase H-like nuclease